MIIEKYRYWEPSTWTIPKLYWDAFSHEQRIHAICHQLSKIIAYAEYLGENVQANYDMIKKLYDELPDYVKNYVIEYIDEIIDSGRFQDIVERAIEELYGGVYIPNNLNFEIAGVRTHEQAGVWKSMQGGCMGADGMIFQIDINSDPGNTDLPRCYVISPTSGNILRENALNVGHANSCTYKDGKVYVTYNTTENEEDEFASTTRTVKVIDYASVTLDETVYESDVDLYSIAYHPSSDTFYGINQWKQGQTNYLYKLNEDFTVNEAIVIDVKCGRSSACLGVVGYMLCVITLLPNQAVFMNENGTILGVSQINNNVSNSYYLNEPEWIYGTKDEFFIGCRLFASYAFGTGNHAFFKSSFTNNGLEGSATQQSVSNQLYKRLFVNPDNQAFKRFGTFDNPYQNIYEALNALQGNDWKRAYIQLAEGDYSDYRIDLINAIGNVVIESLESTEFAGIRLQSCNHVRIVNVNPAAIASGDDSGFNIAMTDSNLTLLTTSTDFKLKGNIASTLKLNTTAISVLADSEFTGTVESQTNIGVSGIVDIDTKVDNTIQRFTNGATGASYTGFETSKQIIAYANAVQRFKIQPTIRVSASNTGSAYGQVIPELETDTRYASSWVVPVIVGGNSVPVTIAKAVSGSNKKAATFTFSVPNGYYINVSYMRITF